MTGPGGPAWPAGVRVTAACRGCGACLLTCPEHAIRPVHDRGIGAPLTVLPGRCTGCGECVENFDYATDLVCDEEALAAAVDALAGGAAVVADVAMVAVGITGCPVVCKIREPLTQRLARTANITRAAAAVRLAFGEVGPGAVWVVGCAPTALQEILTRGVEPAFVVGLPVGFVGAAEAKDALRASGLRALTNVSEKGGSAVAAAALNALLRAATGQSAGQQAPAGRDDEAAR